MVFAGHDFRDEALLDEALTTPSCRMDRPSVADNQRLEFLGDAVIGFLAAESLYAAFPRDTEGSLTVKRTRMVSTAALCDAAERLGLAAHLKRNRAADPLPRDSKTLADAIEALVGAAYLDGGLDAAREVFAALSLSHGGVDAGAWGGNPKGALQIRAQAMNPPRLPEYEVVGVAGKAHEPVFTVRVSVEGAGEAVASARSHKAAESLAAAKLLELMRDSAGRSAD